MDEIQTIKMLSESMGKKILYFVYSDLEKLMTRIHRQELQNQLRVHGKRGNYGLLQR